MERKYWQISLWILVVGIVSQACEPDKSATLPVLGPYKVTDNVVDGKLITDTAYTQIRPFQFWDQDSNVVDESTVDGKYYVTDFFFTSCPTICPKMKQQMLRLHDEFMDDNEVLLLSHSIDPKRDSVARLKTFADKLGINSEKWHLVTGNRDSIYAMAKHYMIAAQKDDKAPGGFAHSGAFLLVDKSRQIRGIYDGTDPDDVDNLMRDLKALKNVEKDN